MRSTLVARAERVGEPAPLAARRDLDFLLGRARCRPIHPADKIDSEDASIVGRPPGQVGRHMPHRGANLEHAIWPGVAEQGQHGPRVRLPGVAAQSTGKIGLAEPRRELCAVHGHDARVRRDEMTLVMTPHAITARRKKTEVCPTGQHKAMSAYRRRLRPPIGWLRPRRVKFETALHRAEIDLEQKVTKATNPCVQTPLLTSSSGQRTRWSSCHPPGRRIKQRRIYPSLANIPLRTNRRFCWRLTLDP